MTQANWATVTASNHGFADGDKVVFWNSGRMDDLNGRVFTVANKTTNTFQLRNTNSSSWGSFRSSDNVKVAKCARNDCAPTITASGHGLSDGEGVYITDVGGFAGLNSRPYVVSGVSGSTFRINTVLQGQYSSGGKSWCGRYGCTWRVFNNAYGNLTAFEASKCVSERTGTNAYTDTSPGSAKVGFNYASSNNACPASALMPLSSDIGALKSKIDGLQIGAAWGWYAVSPNFSSLWTGTSAPGAHDPDRLLKAVILMTDGEFNTPYCSGVIAWDAGDGSGAYQDKINCAATNGDAFDQAEALCDAMKAQGILVYTVGFQVAANGAAADIMRECASTTETAYLPASGSDLTDAFRAIGRDITRLRISK